MDPVPWTDVEIDVVEMTVGCAEQCSHCSESPERGLRHADLAALLEGVSALVELEEDLACELFGFYCYPFPASDPFAYPALFDLCDGIWALRGLPVYLLSLGWNRRSGAAIARRFCSRPDSLFRIAITVSNFSLLAQRSPERHRQRLAASLRDLRGLWSRRGPDDRPLVLVSPQYVDGAPDSSPHSRAQTDELLHDVCDRAGIGLRGWQEEKRVFPRPVIGLGRAVEELDVTISDDYPISAEHPIPPISKYPERRFSGLVNMYGDLEILDSPRGLLGRERQGWSYCANLSLRQHTAAAAAIG